MDVTDSLRLILQSLKHAQTLNKNLIIGQTHLPILSIACAINIFAWHIFSKFASFV